MESNHATLYDWLVYTCKKTYNKQPAKGIIFIQDGYCVLSDGDFA
jgi:hypothetical protein